MVPPSNGQFMQCAGLHLAVCSDQLEELSVRNPIIVLLLCAACVACSDREADSRLLLSKAAAALEESESYGGELKSGINRVSQEQLSESLADAERAQEILDKLKSEYDDTATTHSPEFQQLTYKAKAIIHERKRVIKASTAKYRSTQEKG